MNFQIKNEASNKNYYFRPGIKTWKIKNSVCSLELSAAYFQSASSIFLSHKSANSTFGRLFSAQANTL
jgi:hypothetical protein